eukprot:PhF_6_TR8153/c0_g1_i1/m.12530
MFTFQTQLLTCRDVNSQMVSCRRPSIELLCQTTARQCWTEVLEWTAANECNTKCDIVKSFFTGNKSIRGGLPGLSMGVSPLLYHKRGAVLWNPWQSQLGCGSPTTTVLGLPCVLVP